ncbi:hypothetical protein M231_05547 [Tremella mesenterica]|uniref:Uncharacterized protein n=1 Tax=Tremella mesenterica TaxID=5217 RepID=A0A4Q1BHS8_TREME|nr:hypothetical protein M231_05547 [Tremella mesenterica]
MLVRSVALVAALGGVLAAPANLTKRASGKEPDAAPVKQFFGAGSVRTFSMSTSFTAYVRPSRGGMTGTRAPGG